MFDLISQLFDFSIVYYSYIYLKFFLFNEFRNKNEYILIYKTKLLITLIENNLITNTYNDSKWKC